MPRPYSGASYTPFSAATKRAALARSGGFCERCGTEALPPQYDHHVPDSAGGTNDLSNCVVLCIPCHSVKSEAERQAGIQRAAAQRTQRREAFRNIEPHPNRPRL